MKPLDVASAVKDASRALPPRSFSAGVVQSKPFWFALVGASGLVVDLLTYSVLVTLFALPVARAVAIWLAMTWNFMLNRRLTFRHARSRSVIGEYARFCTACLAGAVTSWSVSIGLTGGFELFERHKIAAAIVGVAVAAGVNYVLCCRFVFTGRAPKRVRSAPPEAMALQPWCGAAE